MLNLKETSYHNKVYSKQYERTEHNDNRISGLAGIVTLVSSKVIWHLRVQRIKSITYCYRLKVFGK